MDLGWDTRPVSLSRHARDWRSQTGAGSSSTSPPAFSPMSLLSQRRRSSATQMPPAAPPPTQPIPKVPVLTTPSPATISDNNVEYLARVNGHVPNPQPPSILTTFPRSRNESFSTIYDGSSASLPENLSDPPPRSILHIVSSSSHDLPQHQDLMADRLLLSPQDPQPRSEQRPSSRRALTRALELAREAVKLDSTNTDPFGAVIAYGQSVALLSDVMERVRRGEDSTESSSRRRNGRRRSVVAQEEEVRRLKSIHDTYADRMNILSLIYSIPPMPHSPSSVYASTMSISSNSTRPPSPSSVSVSPDSPQRAISSENKFSLQDDRYRYWENNSNQNGTDGRDGVESSGVEALVRPWSSRGSTEPENTAPISHSGAGTTGRTAPLSNPSSSYHPYAAVDLPNQATPTNMVHPISRAPSSPPVRRPRASSNLPPPPPPPLTSPPPPPAPVVLEPPLEPSSSQTPHPETSRTRDATLPGSRLAALEEEVEKFDESYGQDQQLQLPYRSHENEAADTKSRFPDTPRVLKKDAPLPALPSPSFRASGPNPVHNTALAMEKAPPSPGSSNFMVPRPRGSSTLSVRSESSTQSQLINSSPVMGTISQRRSKTSAPPSTDSSPPTEPSSAIVGQKLTAASMSSNTASSLGIGRNRSSSQPGRRPSLVNGRISPHDQRPPLPTSVTPNGSIAPRKVSMPSKLNPSLQGPQVSDSSSPLAVVPPAALLIPPPPIVQAKLPTTPISPLPPAPPTDALRKPYHLMNLLRITMTSRTGGYITRRLHVPLEVWSQGGAKLTNVLEKVRVVEVLCSAFEELEASSVEYFGAGNVSSGLSLGIGSIGRREGELWLSKLEEFSSVCDGVVGNFGKKLGVGEGFVIKKASGVTSWGGKLTRQLDKFTNGKNLDSPAEYVQGLAKLFSHAQLLDEHTKALSGQPIAPAYAAFPADIRSAAEVKLKHTSEFFARVVLTFVIRDLSQLLDKYVKKCEKWLAE